MSFWLEIHCDIKAEEPPTWYAEHLTAFCYTDYNDNPAVKVGNTAKSVAKGRAIAGKRAEKDGWQHSRKHGWMCPNCKTTR